MVGCLGWYWPYSKGNSLGKKRVKIGDAVVELDEDLVLQTLRESYTAIVLRFVKKDKDITQRKLDKAVEGVYRVRATLTNTRIELYHPGIKTMEDVYDVIDSVAEKLNKVLTHPSHSKSSKARSGYRNNAPTRR